MFGNREVIILACLYLVQRHTNKLQTVFTDHLFSEPSEWKTNVTAPFRKDVRNPRILSENVRLTKQFRVETHTNHHVTKSLNPETLGKNCFGQKKTGFNLMEKCVCFFSL